MAQAEARVRAGELPGRVMTVKEALASRDAGPVRPSARQYDGGGMTR